jgi:hypothetical protein
MCELAFMVNWALHKDVISETSIYPSEFAYSSRYANWATDLTYEESWFDCRRSKASFLFYRATRPYLILTEVRTHWLLEIVLRE